MRDMFLRPSRGVLLLSTLLLASVLSGCAGMRGTDDGSTIRVISPEAAVGKPWEWEAMTTPAGTITVPDPEHYTLELGPEGKATARFDCNRGAGAYRITPGTLTFGPLASTRMACPPPSLGDRYGLELTRVTSFFVESGRLYLDLTDNGGTMRFRTAPQHEHACP